jgi:hypothetical protein
MIGWRLGASILVALGALAQTDPWADLKRVK